jgi:hypothetical protein
MMRDVAVFFWCLVCAGGLAQGQGTQPVVAIHDSEFTRALEAMPASGATPTGTGTTGNQWWITQWHYFVMPDTVKETLRSDGTAFTVVGDSNILSGILTNADGSPHFVRPGLTRFTPIAPANAKSPRVVPLADEISSAPGVLANDSSEGIPITVTNDVYTALTNTILNLSAPGVLTNDTGGSGPLTSFMVSGTAYGSLSLSNNGGLNYTPANNFTGVDLFTYQATDGQSTSAVATAAVVVVPGGRLFNDTFVRPANTTTIFPWTITTASPVPGQPNLSGTWIITNNTFIGTSTTPFTYTFAYLDRPAWTNYSIQAQVSVPTMTAVGAALGGRLNPLTGARYAVWMKPENAPDGPPNETGSYQAASLVLYKYSDWTTFKLNEVVVGQVGTNEHTLKAVFQGNIFSAYLDGNLVTNWIDDGSIDGQPAYTSGGIDVETYTFTTAYPPTMSNLVVETSPITFAGNDTYSNTVNTTLSVGAPGVLANDSSGGNGSLTALLANGPAFGSLVLSNNGGFSYTPSNNFAGIDNFAYQATDDQTTSTVANAQIMVLPYGCLFYDGFMRAGNSSSIFPWVNKRGTWSITNSVMLGTCSLDDYGYAYYSANWTDYAVQARIRYPSTSVWGGAIGGRLNPATGAHYDVWILPENSPWGPDNGVPAGVPTLQILKYSDWFNYAAQDLVPLPAVGTNWHTVKVAFQGSNVFAYFDGNLITNLVDNGFGGQPVYTNGGITAEVYAASPTAYTMSFNNFIVTPLVLNPSYSTKQNNALIVPKPGVLTNDFDVYGTNLIATLIGGPTNGTLNLSTNGGFTYMPATNFSGIDGFVFRASDKLNVLGVGTATITVIPLPVLTATADNQARIYGTTNPALTVSYTGFTNGDGTNVLTGAPALNTDAEITSPIGNYTVTVSQGTLGSTNYTFQFVNGILTVNPADLTLTAADRSKTYGQTALFAGTEFTCSGLVNGNTATNVSLSSSGAGAAASVTNSPYAINASNATGTGLTNYTIQYQPGTLTVNGAVLTVTANDQTRMYSLTNPLLTARYVGFVNHENTDVLQGSPMLSTPAASSSPPGNYPITAAPGTLSADNYTFAFSNGTLTVTSAPAPVILSFVPANQTISVTWSSVAGALYGLQNSSNLTDAGWIDLTPSVTATGPATSQSNSRGTGPIQFYRVKLQPAGP